MCMCEGFISHKVMYQCCSLCQDSHSCSRDFCKQNWTLSCALSHTWIAYLWSNHLSMKGLVCVHFLWDSCLTFWVNQSIWLQYWPWTSDRGCVSGHNLTVCLFKPAGHLLSCLLVISFSKPGIFFCCLPLGWLPTVPCSGAEMYWQMHNSVVCTLHLLTMAPNAGMTQWWGFCLDSVFPEWSLTFKPIYNSFA